jgi:dTDP-4-dehydrorhamnose reductase
MAARHILLLGGSGQVGRELVARPWPAPFILTAPSRRDLDLTDGAAIGAMVASRPWATVINAAAYSAVDKAETAVAEANTVNARGPAILAEATRRGAVPLIHISTDYVFDGSKPAPYDEDDPAHPLGVYGASKLAGEEAVRAGNPRHLVLRTSWLFGRFGGNFVKTMLRLAREQTSIAVVDDQLGTPTAASDLAGMLAFLAMRPDLPDRSGVYHFANAGETTWCGLARRIFKLSVAAGGPSAAVKAIRTEDYPTAARRPMNSRLSTARIRRDFGIVPRPFEEPLAEVVTALVNAGVAGSGG